MAYQCSVCNQSHDFTVECPILVLKTLNKIQTLSKIKEEQQMKLQDLQTGMIVEYCNGEKRLVLRDTTLGNMFLHPQTYRYMENFTKEYTEDMMYKGIDKALSIMKVYKAAVPSRMMTFKDLQLIWKRAPEVKEISAEEAFKALEKYYGEPVKIKEK